MLPRQLGNVDESIHAAQVNECTECNNTRNATCTHFANLEMGQELVTSSTLILLKQCAT